MVPTVSSGPRSSRLAVDETSVILLHPPLPSVDLSAMERERPQNDSLVNG